MSWPLALFVVGQLGLIACILRYYEELCQPKELVEALRFYADPESYVHHGVTADFQGTGVAYTKAVRGPDVMADGGKLAREALGIDEGHAAPDDAASS